MTPLIQNLLTASFHGSVIIVAVLVLRLILRKAPKRVVCVLWMLAFIRLLMPFQLESKLSMQPEVVPLEETTFYETVVENINSENSNTPDLPNGNGTETQPIIPENFDGDIAGEEIFSQLEPETKEEPTPIHWTSMLPYFWMFGASAFLLYAVISYIQLKRTVREAVRIIGCWECDRIETAFILGYIRPRIYVPMGLSRRTRKHILAHEWAHLQTGDHWFKLLAYLACCLHWFNPLVWIAYRLMCMDMEHACDERVVRYMNLEARKQYSHALLTCSTNHSHYTPCPVAFGEVSVKSRILSVLNYRKPSFWITLIAVIAVACVGVFLMTSPEKADERQKNELRQQIATLEEQISNDPFYNGIEVENLKELLNVTPSAAPTIPITTKTVTVSNVDQLLAAIAPDTHIILEAGTYNLWEAANYGKAGSAYYEWGNDNQLELCGLENLIISGNGTEETVILAQPSQADVLYVTDCHNVYLENFTLGHLERPYPYTCTGYALTLDKSTNILMDSLGLYGCGVIGLNTQLCSNLLIQNSDIYDCSFHGVVFDNTYFATVENCRFYDIGIPQSVAGSVIALSNTNSIAVTDCEITNNYVRKLLTSRNGYDVKLSDNQFSRNTVSDAAFYLNSSHPVAVDNRFEKNDLLSWYEGANKLVDSFGAQITEETLDSMHVTAPKNIGTQTEVHVSTVDELLAAIAPDTHIVLDAETYDLSKASGYGTTNGNYYYWQQAYDGYELVIYKVNNMTIRSNDDNMKKHTISAVPRYANVLHFNLCSNINLSGFTAGHTEAPGGCDGGVIRLTGSETINVENCGLFGCGTIGVDIWSSKAVTIDDCDIYECSVGGVCVFESDTVTITDTSFRDLGGYNGGYQGYVVAVLSSSNVTLDGEEVTDRINYSAEKLNADNTSLSVNGEIADSISAEVGTFLRIEPVGVPENTAVTWSYIHPDVISGIPQSDHYRVEITGVGKSIVTAMVGNVRKDLVITAVAPEDSSTESDFQITYAERPVVECTGGIGETIPFGTDNLPDGAIPVVIWSTDNPDAVSVEYTSETTCSVTILSTGEATVSAYCGGETAILKIYCRESW